VATTYKNRSLEEVKTKSSVTGSPLLVLGPAGLTEQLLMENINTNV
jgi:hypothetical protein